MNLVKSGFYKMVVILTLLANLAHAQINTPSGAIIPFGSNASYPYGMMPTNLPTGGTYGKSTDAANAYNTWKSNYIVACSGSQFRVKFDDPNQTVSEGIAYGMLLSAYAADKTLFDGLWAYYKANTNGNVMNWRIQGCNNASGSNGATDAELDAALALMVADAQWPLATTPYDYTVEATTLIGKIKASEMDPANYQANNGDAWGNATDCRNPSYQAPAYYRLYATAVPADATFWGTNAVNGAYTLIQANAHATTGLVSDWSSKTGTTSACQSGSSANTYGYDACRNPWRMATDVIWFNEPKARTQCDKIASYVNSQGAANCGGPRQQNGSGSGGHFATFVSMYAAGVMGGTPATYQSLLNSMYSQTVGVSDYYQNSNPSGYFGNTLRCLSLFVMSGNFWKPGTSLTPEVNVQLNGNNVLNASNIDLGNVQQGTNGNFTFTIQNLGASALTIGTPTITGTGAAKYTIQTAPPASIAANSSATFVLRFTPGAGVTGAFNATITFTNNDPTDSENPYVINVLTTATSNPTAPEIDVQYKAISYAVGSNLSIGNITQSAIGYKIFTITNTGTAALTISSITLTGTGYALYGTAPTSVAAGSAASFTVAISANASPTTQNGTVTINNNDGNEGTYLINLSASIVSCTNSITASQVLMDYDGNNNVTLNYTPASFTIIPNANIDATNYSPMVGSITRDATTYVTMRYQPGCGSSGSFDMTNPVVSFLIYSPAAGIPVILSPKTSAGAVILGDYSSDVKAVTSKANQWERLYFDMSKIGGYTNVRFFDIMIDPTGVNGTPSKLYKIDDLRYDVANCITSLPSTQVFLDYDNERNLTFQYAIGGTSTMSEVFPNPSATGINISANVAKFVRANTGKYQGFRYSGCQNKIDLSSNGVISMKVYSGAINIPIQMSMSDASGTSIKGVTVKTTVANGWEKLYFDFSSIKTSTLIANLDVFPDTGAVFTSNLTYYFDDIRYDQLPCATPATADAGADIIICAGGTASLTGTKTNATGAIWSNGNGTFAPSATSLAVTYTPSAGEITAGYATLTLTTTGMGSGCTAASDQVVVTIQPALTVSNAGTDQTVCAATATLAGNTATSGTGAWTVIAGSGVVTTPASPTSGVTGLSAGVNTFRWTISSGTCTPSTDDITITRTASPTADAGIDQTICATSNATLTGAVTNAISGTWTTSGTGTFSPNANILTPVYTPSNADKIAGSVTLTLTSTGNGSCTAATDQMVITLTPAPTTSNAGADQTVCAATATLAATAATIGTGAWTVVSGTGTVTTPSSPTSGVTGLVTGALTLRWTISNGTCTPSTDDVVITRSAAPTVSNAGADQTICATSATLAANAATVGTGAWTVTTGTGVVTTPSSATSAVTGLSVGSNILRWTISNAPCTASYDEVEIVVTGGITTANAGADQTVCAATATLAANVATSGTGAWTVVSGTGTVTTPSSPTSGVTGLVTGALTLRWTISNGTCTPSTDDVVITRSAAPTVANAGADQNICSTSATLAGNAATVGTGAWTVTTGTGVVTTPSSATSAVTGLSVGSNILRWTISNAPCTASYDEVEIVVTGGITTANAGADQTVCAATATLAANVATSGTGAWTVVSGTGTVTTPSSPTSGVTGLVTGALTLRWTISNGTCTPSTDDVVITRSAAPTVANAGADQNICAATATLAANAATVGTGTWTVESGTGVFGTASSATTSVTGLSVGTNVLRWTISNAPCSASYDEVTIVVTGGITTANAGPDQNILAPATSATLAANVATSGTGAWSVVSGTGVVSTPSSPTSTVTGLVTGSVTLRWTISNTGCTSSTDDVVITVGSVPVATTISGPTTVSPNQTNVTYTFSPVNAGSTYTWTLPPGSSIVSSGSGTVTVNFGNSPGNVSLTETNAFGTYTSDLAITVGATGVLSGLGADTYEAYPTPFDETAMLKVNSIDNVQMKVKVMDSKGMVVYSTNEFYTNQDITIGKGLSTGVYFVEISYQNKLQVVKLVKM